MAAYQLVDPSYFLVDGVRTACYGICPVCKVAWSARPDCSCDCFSVSQAGKGRKQKKAQKDSVVAMRIRQTLMQVIDDLRSVADGEVRQQD